MATTLSDLSRQAQRTIKGLSARHLIFIAVLLVVLGGFLVVMPLSSGGRDCPSVLFYLQRGAFGGSLCGAAAKTRAWFALPVVAVGAIVAAAAVLVPPRGGGKPRL